MTNLATPTTNSQPPKSQLSPPSNTSNAIANSATSITSSVVVVLLAFLIGLFTPPTLHHIHTSNHVPLLSLPWPTFPFNRTSTTTSSAHSSVQRPLGVPCTPSNLQQYLHDAPVRGLHVICVEVLHLDPSGKNDAGNFLRLTFYKNSHSGPLHRRVTIHGPTYGVSTPSEILWTIVAQHLTTELGLSGSTTKQPWALFSATGERIIGENDKVNVDSNDSIMNQLISSEMLLLTEGGNWIWPGVREGFRRSVQISSPPTTVIIETLSLQPLVLSIEGFLTHDECDSIATKAAPRIQYSQVSLMDRDKGKAASEWRTSQSTFLSSANDPLLTSIDHRVSSLTRIPRSHHEFVQVLRYGIGEKYDAHHDYFNPNSYRSDQSTMNLIQGGRRNRFATVLWYLTSVPIGGETIFPRVGGQPASNPSDCSVGLKVRPQKGKVIVFYSLNAAGELDETSLHGACPVGEGVKWAANKWVWNAPMGYVTDD